MRLTLGSGLIRLSRSARTKRYHNRLTTSELEPASARSQGCGQSRRSAARTRSGSHLRKCIRQSCRTAKAPAYRSARSRFLRYQPVRYNLAVAMGRRLAPGGAQYSAAFSPWLKRNLRTIQFIDDPASGSEHCLTDGHGCLQSDDASRPNTMLLRIPFLRAWRHSSGNSNSHLIAAWKRPVGLQNPRTEMRAPHRTAPVTRIRSQHFPAKWRSLRRRSAVLSSNWEKTPASRAACHRGRHSMIAFILA